MIHFEATEDQVKKMASLACQASEARGLGYLHASSQHSFPPEMFSFMKGHSDLELHVDYCQGRMVKLSIWRSGPGKWRMRDTVTPDYQSWCNEYTPEALIAAAGGRVLEAKPQ